MQITRILLPDGGVASAYSSIDLETDLLQLRGTASFADDPDAALGFITMVMQHIAYNVSGRYKSSALVFTEEQTTLISEQGLAKRFLHFQKKVKEESERAISSRGKYWNLAIAVWTRYDATPLEALRYSIHETKREEAKRKAEEERRRAKSHNPKHDH